MKEGHEGMIAVQTKFLHIEQHQKRERERKKPIKRQKSLKRTMNKSINDQSACETSQNHFRWRKKSPEKRARRTKKNEYFMDVLRNFSIEEKDYWKIQALVVRRVNAKLKT